MGLAYLAESEHQEPPQAQGEHRFWFSQSVGLGCDLLFPEAWGCCSSFPAACLCAAVGITAAAGGAVPADLLFLVLLFLC